MFDLEKQIAAWREQFSRALPGESQVLDELESHLRDEIDGLTRAGRSPEQAWQIATTKLGDAKTMAEEFAKTSASRWLPARLSLGVLLICAVALIVLLISRGQDLLLASHVFTITAGYLSTLTLGALGISAAVSRAAGHFEDRQGNALRYFGIALARAAIALTCAGIVLGAVWLRINRGPWWQWDPREIGGVCVLGWNFVMLRSLRSREFNISTTILATIVGNIIITAAWLGPLTLESHHAALIRPTLGVFLIIHLACAYVAMLPIGDASEVK